MTRTLFFKLLMAGSAITFLGIACDRPIQSPTQSGSPPMDSSATHDSTRKGEIEPTAASIGGRLSVKWPLGVSPSGWTGVDGDRTGTSSYHRGAEYYARDLAHPSYTRVSIHAGISGQVVKVYKTCANINSACNGGYGNEVVVYDWSRHVAVRYAHLSFVALDVNLGTWVSVGRYLGAMGTSGRSSGPHLHIVSFENIDHFSGGWPIIPTPNDDMYYACITAFYF
ncbi:MAG: M23 family metallopeptidase [Candidatus Kerfeldbacteria bacterium]|nr:M23 family metallopeptidase [Candidatus Kerfeldbacteria bacterium]